MKRVFGDEAYKIPISFNEVDDRPPARRKRALEAAVAALAISNSAAPPTINLEEPDADCDLDYIPHVARRGRIRTAMQLVRLRRAQRQPHIQRIQRVASQPKRRRSPQQQSVIYARQGLESSSSAADGYADAIGFIRSNAQLLYNRGIGTADEASAFLEARGRTRARPVLLPDMDKAAARLRTAILWDDTVGVFGDFDTDGVSARNRRLRFGEPGTEGGAISAPSRG